MKKKSISYLLAEVSGIIFAIVLTYFFFKKADVSLWTIVKAMVCIYLPQRLMVWLQGMK